jgi:hypothetical protein
MKPFAESCEQNKEVILEVIQPLLASSQTVFEIGSGTGQHAVFFSQMMPHLQWQPSDKAELLPGIQLWLDDAGLTNVRSPIALDVNQPVWPELQADAVFMANTLHIMSAREVGCLFEKLPEVLTNKAVLLVYGPFNYQGQYTSDSNRQFDAWLKARDPDSGIKNFETLNELANQNGLQIMADFEMPANNRILYWQKV